MVCELLQAIVQTHVAIVCLLGVHAALKQDKSAGQVQHHYHCVMTAPKTLLYTCSYVCSEPFKSALNITSTLVVVSTSYCYKHQLPNSTWTLDHLHTMSYTMRMANMPCSKSTGMLANSPPVHSAMEQSLLPSNTCPA